MSRTSRLHRALVLTILVALGMLATTLAASADTVTVTNTNDSGAGSLRQALLDANPGDVIVFDVTTPATITLTSGEMTRSGELTINGPGKDLLTISGNHASRAINTSSALTLTGVTIRDCSATGDGGAITCDSSVTLTNTCLISNTAQGGSCGAFYATGDVSVTGGALRGNTASTSYGAFRTDQACVISGTEILSNTAQVGSYGAFLALGSATLTNTQLVSNTAGLHFGAFRGSAVEISGGLVERNTAQNGNFGAFTANGDLSIANTQIISNSAGGNDGYGAFSANGRIAISDSLIQGNSAPSGYYGAFWSNDAVVLTSTQVISNTAEDSCGAFYAGGSVALTDCDLVGNTSGGDFGAFHGLQSCIVSGTDIIGNTAGDDYGAFKAEGAVTMTNTQVLSNTAPSGDHGAFQAIGDVILTNSQVSDNTAGTFCGAFFADGAVTVADSLIQSNTAQNGDAGGFRATGHVTITNSSLISNTASQAGGAVYAEDQVTAANTTFRGNGAAGGGALYIAGSGSGLDMRDSLVADSPTGGGLTLDNGPVAVIENSTFCGNHAGPGPSSGGGIRIGGNLVPGTELHLLHCTLTGNDATMDGGGLSVFSAQAYLTDTLVAKNTLSIGDHDPSDITGAVTSGGGNLVGDGTGAVATWLPSDQVGSSGSPIDPVVGALGDYGGDTQTVPLLPGSPAIDEGVASSVANDQRGVTRDGSPDAGAYEARAFQLAYQSGSGQSTVINTAFGSPLVAQVTSDAGDPVDGGIVSFSSPYTGASATFPDDGVATISGGMASITPTANDTLGAYQAQADLAGLSPVLFDLENTESVQGPGAPWIRNYGTLAGGWSSFDTYPRWTGDVNGDGRDDIVAFGNKATYVSLSTGTAYTAPAPWIYLYGPGAGGWSSYDLYPRMLGDVNGDGRDDIVAFGNRATYVSLSAGASFSPPVPWILLYGPSAGGWMSQDTYPRMLGDVNGDGMDDLVAFGNRATYVSLSTGAGFLPPAEWIRLYGPAAGGWTSYDTFPRFIDDVNGDGMGDIVAFGNKATYVSLSTGSAFGPPIPWAVGLGPAAGGWMTQDGQTRLVGDIDGDGKTDIVAFGGSATYAWRSTTGSLGLYSWFYTNDRGWTSQNLYPRDLGDANGNGRLNVVGFGSDGTYVQ